MYSNDPTQIRHGMVNYVGALVKASKLPPKAARQDVAAILIEEALKLAREEDNQYDLYVLKPLLRAINLIVQNRTNAFNELPVNMQKQASMALEDYLKLSDAATRILKTIEKNTNQGEL